jgi:hypothetical protein
VYIEREAALLCVKITDLKGEGGDYTAFFDDTINVYW